MSWEPFKMFEAMIEGLPPFDKETLAAATQMRDRFVSQNWPPQPKSLREPACSPGCQRAPSSLGCPEKWSCTIGLPAPRLGADIVGGNASSVRFNVTWL